MGCAETFRDTDMQRGGKMILGVEIHGLDHCKTGVNIDQARRSTGGLVNGDDSHIGLCEYEMYLVTQ